MVLLLLGKELKGPNRSKAVVWGWGSIHHFSPRWQRRHQQKWYDEYKLSYQTPFDYIWKSFFHGLTSLFLLSPFIFWGRPWIRWLFPSPIFCENETTLWVSCFGIPVFTVSSYLFYHSEPWVHWPQSQFSFLGCSGDFIRAFMASKTTLNCSSYFFSNEISLRSRSLCADSICRNRTNARMISVLTCTARLLLKTLESPS